MKKSLIILSIMGLSATQVNASVELPVESQKINQTTVFVPKIKASPKTAVKSVVSAPVASVSPIASVSIGTKPDLAKALSIANNGTSTKVITKVNASTTTPLIDTKVIEQASQSATAVHKTAKLVEDIESLSAKASKKEDQLAKLAEKLTKETAAVTATSFGTTANTSRYGKKLLTAKAKKVSTKQVRRSSAKLTKSAPPARAAARASRAAKSRTVGLCARYVRKALQSAGYKFTPNPSAYQYATRGTLAKAGFVKISNRSKPQVGDVVVYNRSAKHIHGHIQIWDGRNWVSDFRQRNKSPYRGKYSYTTWRDARYLDNASNKGVYLAMGE